MLHQLRPLQWQRKISRYNRAGPRANINAPAPTAAAAAAINTAGIDVAPGADMAGRVYLHLCTCAIVVAPPAGRRRSLAKPQGRRAHASGCTRRAGA